MRSDDLLAAVFPDQAACAENLVGEIRIPDHPLVKETVANCLYEGMDLNGLRAVIAGIASGAIRTVAVETVEPSPLSHEILNANPYAYLDDAPLEERRARAVQLRRGLKTDLADGVGALDANAIAQVAQESWPLVRDPDELHDALLTLILFPVGQAFLPALHAYYDQLAATGRASTIEQNGAQFWVATERLAQATACPPTALLRGWLDSTGPTTASKLADQFRFPKADVDIALAQLEAEGQVLRGRFTPNLPPDELEWCNRRILARIHRMTIGRLRREIEPVTTADFIRFLCAWHHLTPGSQLHGVDGA